MQEENLKYFKLAKELNEKFHNELLEKEAHFRGNINSFSLISLSRETPEKGVSVTKENAEEKLLRFKPEPPKRETPEKSLQSWIILNAIRNNHILPFGDNLTFITSELAIQLENKKVVNDILAIDKDNNLVVIELKSIRVNQVKEQALEFKQIILSDEYKIFFKQLTELMTCKVWNGEIRCMIVWPKTSGKPQKPQEKYKEIEEYQYSGNYIFERL
jgi:hypothetical protein